MGEDLETRRHLLLVQHRVCSTVAGGVGLITCLTSPLKQHQISVYLWWQLNHPPTR